jgi:acetate kinase
MTETILALNTGSSTLKYSVYQLEGEREQELSSATIKMTDQTSAFVLERVLAHMRSVGLTEPSLIGHRLVHGGATFTAPVRVDAGVLEQLDALVSLAPLHLPPALGLLRQALQRWPAALHVACFDTSFHETLPDVARRFALPARLYERGIRRYGFHGLSCEYVLSELGFPPPAKLIIAHLGSGASLTAIKHGRSIDTSMGLTPAGGIPMGTRSGDLDPGVLLHLIREQGYSAEELERLLNHESGLKGLAGSADMSELLSRAAAIDTSALLAIELFAYAIKKQIGAYFAALGGLDCLVFTGGIGEHVPLVRELACTGLEALGIELNASFNSTNAPIISSGGAACEVRVMTTNEDLVIARSTLAVHEVLQIPH